MTWLEPDSFNIWPAGKKPCRFRVKMISLTKCHLALFLSLLWSPPLLREVPCVLASMLQHCVCDCWLFAVSACCFVLNWKNTRFWAEKSCLLWQNKVLWDWWGRTRRVGWTAKQWAQTCLVNFGDDSKFIAVTGAVLVVPLFLCCHLIYFCTAAIADLTKLTRVFSVLLLIFLQRTINLFFCQLLLLGITTADNLPPIYIYK